MSRDDIVEAVLDAVRARNLSAPPNSQLRCAPDAALLGPDSPLDSLGLVALLIDVEDAIAAHGHVTMTLSDERAMSRSRSPFRDVPALVEFIEERLRECAASR